MVERRKIVESWKRGGAVALATLVQVEGSSYRTAGARLLIASDGTHVGSVSGGCLEAEIVRKARWITRNGAAIERYSTLFDDTSDIPYGLGCGGTVHVLLEPVETAECRALLQAMESSLQGQSRHVITTLPETGLPMQREIRDESGQQVFASAAASRPAGRSVYRESLLPPQRLFLCGAGDDAQAMVNQAALLGWNTYVFDGRMQLARAERFPQAHTVLAAREFSTLCPHTGDAAVLMTHSYEQDCDWLTAVLPCEPRYVGLLGSRHRSALLVAEAARRLGWPVERACQRLFSPVGLNLGGDGAEAIALSAIAEIQACTQGKLPHSRRMTAEAVAQLLERGHPRDAAAYLQAQCAL